MIAELKERELMKRLLILSYALECTDGLERLDPKLVSYLEITSEKLETLGLIEKYDDHLATEIENELLTELTESFLSTFNAYINEGLDFRNQ